MNAFKYSVLYPPERLQGLPKAEAALGCLAYTAHVVFPNYAHQQLGLMLLLPNAYVVRFC